MEYHVGRAGSQCAITGRTFAEGEPIIAAIYELPGGESFVRKDFSPEAFRQAGGRIVLEDQTDSSPAFSHWQSVIRPATSKKRVFVDDAVLVDFFERLAGSTEMLRIQFRYVIGLILMRKRILRYESAQTNDQGQESWQMTLFHPTLTNTDGSRQKSVCTMIRPQIDEAQISQLSAQLGSILAGDGGELG